MIISRTPFRIPFFGGGNYDPASYLRHGGSVLAATIDKFCYLSCRGLPPFRERRIRIVYSQIEDCASVEEIQHPAVREVLRFLNITRGLEIHHEGDLPARSGMGTSSAFTVGLLHALHALEGRMPSKHQLAMEGVHIEQERLRETVGAQDPVIAAYGGLNHIAILPTGGISVRPVPLAPGRIRELNANLMLFYTRIARSASEVARMHMVDVDGSERQIRILNEFVDEGLALLNSDKDIALFGQLLKEGWQVQAPLSAQVSNDAIEDIYARAVTAGAIGGKLLGADGGGFLLLFVPPEHHRRVREQLCKLIHVPFKFEWAGSQIIVNDPEPCS